MSDNENIATDEALGANTSTPLFSIKNVQLFLLSVPPPSLNYAYTTTDKSVAVAPPREQLAK
jgi:hypothetical protein